MKSKYANPRAGNAGAAEYNALGRAVDKRQSSPNTLQLQASRIRRQATVSWHLARAMAGLAYAVPEKWGRD